jgi:hypothetical protein
MEARVPKQGVFVKSISTFKAAVSYVKGQSPLESYQPGHRFKPTAEAILSG